MHVLRHVTEEPADLLETLVLAVDGVVDRARDIDRHLVAPEALFIDVLAETAFRDRGTRHEDVGWCP